MNNFFIGYSVCATIALLWTIYLLKSKPTEVKEVNIRKAKMKRNQNSKQEFTQDLGGIIKEEFKKRRRRRKFLTFKNR